MYETLNHLRLRFAVSVNEEQESLPTFYWLLKLHKQPYRHIRHDLLLILAHAGLPNYQNCYYLLLSKTMLLDIVKKSMKDPVKIFFGQLKKSCEVLNKLKSRGFCASSLSTYDFSTSYTTLPYNLIKDIERIFQREGSFYIACNDRNAFFTSDAVSNYKLWSCQKVCEALTFLLEILNILDLALNYIDRL